MRGREVLICLVLVNHAHSWEQKIKISKSVLKKGGGVEVERDENNLPPHLICPREAVSAPNNPFCAPFLCRN